MNGRIILDKGNLQTLVRLMSASPGIIDDSEPLFLQGYSCAVEVLSAIADEMPSFDSPVRTYPVDHRNPSHEDRTVAFDAYQLANLRRLINAVYHGDTRSAGAFNTGDWLAEVKFLLDGNASIAANPVIVRNSTDAWMDHVVLCEVCNNGKDFCEAGQKLVLAAREERDGP